jgi:AI-2 transport protein TqsA
MSGDRPITVMLALCTAIIVGAALYFASSIFAPLAFALLMLAIVWPLQKKLQTLLPKTLALLLTLLVTVVVITVFASMVAWGFSVIGQWMVANAARFQAVYAGWADWLEQHDIFIGAVIAERFDMMWLVRVFHEIAARLNRFVGFALLVFIFLMMMLLEAEMFAAKLAKSGRPELVQACAEIGWKFRRYMLVRTLLSLLTGLLVWLFARAMGLEPAPAWGIISFALNYIPFIGPPSSPVPSPWPSSIPGKRSRSSLSA